MKLAVVSNKGGVGKTTLSMNIAYAFSQLASTAVLDADPQQSSTHWVRVGKLSGFELPQVVPLEGRSLVEEARKLESEHEHLILDCPPSIEAEQTREALTIADVALVPVQPSPVDLWATVHIATKVKEAQEVNPGLQAVLLLNQLEPRTTLSKVMQGALGQLGLPALPVAIRRRAVFRNCLLDGRTVYHSGVKGVDAVKEIDSVIEEIRKL